MRARARDIRAVEDALLHRRSSSPNVPNGSHIPDPTPSSFLARTPTDVLHTAIRRFIRSTGNHSVRTAVCMSCSRERDETSTRQCYVDRIPHREKLVPTSVHHAYYLHKGMLLCKQALFLDGGRWKGALCNDCEADLRNEKFNVPRYALANDLWIGDVPHELKVLSLAERLLVARYIPVVKSIKLYPQTQNGRSWDPDRLNWGMAGNVSSYPLKTDAVDDMLRGKLLPQPPSFLSSVLAITVVGPKNFPEKGFKGLFRVRRQQVHAALLWLKSNNPLYANVKVDEQALSLYPLDGIPDVVYDIMRHEEDPSVLERERDSYVPDEEISEDQIAGVPFDIGGR